MTEFDSWTIKHLDQWLSREIGGEAYRTKVRERMLEFANRNDAEYWASQSWWNLFDRSRCDRIATGE
jgi:hypothetical protein